MAKKKSDSDEADNPSTDSKSSAQLDSPLHRLAEKKAKENEPNIRVTLSPEEVSRVLHELRVHQIELEMQNDELRRVHETEEALRTRYFDMYDLAPVGYFVLNEQGMILEANLTAATLLGEDRVSLVKKQITNFIYPGDQNIYYLHRKSLFETGETIACELQMMKKDGTKFWVHLDTTTVQEDDNALVYRVVLSDITERKLAAEKIKKEKETAQQYLDIAGSVLLVLDATGKINLVNRKGCEILDGTSDELTGLNWFDHFPPKEEREKLKEIFATLMRGEIKPPVEYVENRIISKKGNEKLIRWHNTIIKNNDGTIFGTLSSGEDITERKQTERMLEVSELSYRRLFESAKDGLLVLDFDTGKITDVNQFITNLLGYSKTDLLEKHLWEIGSFKDLFQSKDTFLTLQTKEYIRYEYLPLETKDGKKIDVEFVSNVYDVDGRKTIRCSIRDITERKKAQDELKESNEKLKESFKQIQNQKNELERTSRDLEEKNRHLNEFATSVAHDLRSPLRSISGFSQVLLEEYKDNVNDQMKHYLERIIIGTKKMGDLMDDLLYFSRIARADLQYETVDVTKIITNIIKDQTAAHPERTLDFVVQPLPSVEADGKMVETIFVNLIENAVKFTSKQKNAHIEIGSRQDKDQQQFFVKDNGVGFDERFKDKLFVPFQRLQSENEFEGSGIGLALVARLVTKHGGQVWAEGEIDRGATFYFTLPLKKSNLWTLESFQRRYD
jgi:PAS domain S-box-containing protein